ncbi:UBX domain-containing protein 4 [Podospora conica]|nr:UBX domain-containing protein 4 [Schizothecium conicum]
MSFFQGNLQEGIATAVQQSKSVVCFVTDNEAESVKWQDEYLTDDTVAPILESDAVVLRLESGSQEEGFLAQLYPLPKKPTVVVIKNAELREYIAAGVSKEDFVRRLRQALQPLPVPAPEPSPVAAEHNIAPAPAPAPASLPPPVARVADTGSVSSTSSGPATPTSTAANEAQIQSLLAERAARLAAQKKKEEEDAKQRRIEKAKAKADNIAAGKAPDAQSKHAETLKKKQREAREERQRVLKAIEDDKAARKARQAEQAALRRAAEATTGEAEAKGVPFAPASQLYPSTGRIHENCALQVRLLDGSTIRSRFSSRDTLKDVRQWVDDTAQLGKTAYTFKVLMTPLPSVKLDVTEEDKQLQELGLTPSATLILLPVRRRFAAAYDDAPPPGNIFMRWLAYMVAYISGFFGVILSFIGTLFSTAGPPPPLVENPSIQGHASGRDGGQDSAARQRRNEQQFYNGNSTNFQPRVDDEDDDEYDN